MKNLLKISSLVLIALIMMAQKCAQTEIEELIDEDESYRKAMYGSNDDIAIREWTKCQNTSVKLIAIAESNLKTLKSKVKNAQEFEKHELDTTYEQHTFKLNKLKGELESHNNEINTGGKEIDDATVNSYRSFNNFLLQQLIDLNKELEGDIESGQGDTP